MLEGWGDRMSFPKSVFPILLFVGTAAGVTDHVWSVPDIATIIETAEPAPAKLGPYKKASDRLRRICVGTWSADKRIANTASGIQRRINRQKPMGGAMSIYNSMRPSISWNF